MFRRNDHWTRGLYELTMRCKSFSELADIGIMMVCEFKKTIGDRQVSMLSGPMTTGGLGNFDTNMEVFGHCIDIARERGVGVFNQLPFQTSMINLLKLSRSPTFNDGDVYPQTILDDFYWPLMSSGLIERMYFLPTWETSNGAKQEWRKAAEIGTIEIHAYEKPWYEEAMKRAVQSLRLV